MTATSDPVPATTTEEVAPPEWRSNLGRLRLFAALVVAGGLFAVWALCQPFYEMNLTDVALVDETYQRTAGVDVSASVSAFDLVAQDPQEAVSAHGAGVANTNVPASMFALPVLGKLPAAGAWLLLAAAALFAACASQSLFALAASGASWVLAFRAHSAMVALAEDPAAGGLLVERAYGIGLFEVSMFGMAALGAPIGVLLWKARAARREDRKRRAKEAGESLGPDISWIDWLRGAAMTGASVVADNARRSAESRQGG